MPVLAREPLRRVNRRCGAAREQYHPISTHQPSMLVGEVFLETMATGIITQQEIDWLTTHQAGFSREEEAMALKIGRLLDEGQLQIGCRLLGKDAPDAHLAS